jgi:eukaryotic-like serine/threonine-protein kinase
MISQNKSQRQKKRDASTGRTRFMTGLEDDRFRTGGAFDALPDHAFNIETNRLQGRILSGYKVGHVVGSGGMGYVLHATRAEGDFDRGAAIKVVEATHRTSEFAQRFRMEVQILAQLNHPCIAQLYDAGETEEGWPYLVMEYVDGSPIDKYCSHRNLSTDDRVSLLIDVVKAVQFAHAQLVVHRDLKPSNVLVDKSGKLKLLDFGIAKLLNESPEDLSRVGAMTPQYASPEQLLGQPISIATDIYQLGLLFAKVLGGDLPTQGETLTDAIQRAAERRPLTLPLTQRQSLPAELVLVIEQCLRADPADRYRDANALLDDLQAYLSGYPVKAAGQNRGYRFRKFVRRNWGVVLSAGLALAALVSATIITSLQMVEANRQRDIAVYQQQRVQASSEFYSLLMEEMGSGSFTSVELLDRGRELLQDQFGMGQPFMASVLFDVSRRYATLNGLHEHDRELELLREAEAIAREYQDDNMLAAILCAMARSNQLRDPETAANQIAEGTTLYRSLPTPTLETSMECLRAQADAKTKAGDADEALALLFEALQLLDLHPAPGTSVRALLLHDIAFTYFYDGDPKRAMAYLDDLVELLESSGRGSTLAYQRIAANKAVSLVVLGQTPEALETFVDLTQRMRTSGFRGRGSAILLTQYGDLLMTLGRVDDAQAVYTQSLELAESTGDTRIIAASNLGLAKVHLANEAYGIAREHLDAAEAYVNQKELRLGLGVRTHRVKLHRLTGRLDIAVPEIEALLADVGYPKARRGQSVTRVIIEGANVYRQLGDYVKAEALADELVNRLEQSMDPDSEGSIHLGKALMQRAEIRLDTGKSTAARLDLEAALPHLNYALGEDHLVVEHARGLLSGI